MASWCCSSEPPTEEEIKEKEIPFYDQSGRKVRDIFCLVTWIVCWLALLGISIWAFSTGDASRYAACCPPAVARGPLKRADSRINLRRPDTAAAPPLQRALRVRLHGRHLRWL